MIFYEYSQILKVFSPIEAFTIDFPSPFDQFFLVSKTCRNVDYFARVFSTVQPPCIFDFVGKILISKLKDKENLLTFFQVRGVSTESIHSMCTFRKTYV